MLDMFVLILLNLVDFVFLVRKEEDFDDDKLIFFLEMIY